MTRQLSGKLWSTGVWNCLTDTTACASGCPTQAAYIQLGAFAVHDAWGDVSHDMISVADAFRSETAALIAAYKEGQYTFEDMGAACQLLVNPDADRDVNNMTNGSRAHALAAYLRRNPFGRVLYTLSAVAQSSLSFGETEYGRCVFM